MAKVVKVTVIHECYITAPDDMDPYDELIMGAQEVQFKNGDGEFDMSVEIVEDDVDDEDIDVFV